MENKTPTFATGIIERLRIDFEENIAILIAFWAGAALATLFFLPEILDGTNVRHPTTVRDMHSEAAFK